MLLQEIIRNKKKEIDAIGDFPKCGAISPMHPKLNFKSYLKGKNNIIAEIKPNAPSYNKLFNSNHQDSLDIKRISCIYGRYANAISVLTDEKFFGGTLDNISIVKEITNVPILRKDFIIDIKQIGESAYYGADAILLIAALLTNEEIDAFILEAKKYGMACMVEVHDKKELLCAIKTKAEIIGINNRDLKTLNVEIDNTIRLKEFFIDESGGIVQDKIIVSESGIKTINDIRKVDANAVLIGTSLMQSEDILLKLKSLRIPKVKICGVTNINDALAAVSFGADMLGFNFYKNSPRYITPQNAKCIIQQIIKKGLSTSVCFVGVFVNESIDNVNSIINDIGLDMVQLHGDEDGGYCNSFTIPVIKGFCVKHNLPSISNYNVFGYLFDNYVKNMYGGTGKPFNHSLLNNFEKKLFISGGINMDNVASVVKSIDPYCIDVCTGVEIDAGIKDHNKMKKFIEAVKCY